MKSTGVGGGVLRVHQCEHLYVSQSHIDLLIAGSNRGERHSSLTQMIQLGEKRRGDMIIGKRLSAPEDFLPLLIIVTSLSGGRARGFGDAIGCQGRGSGGSGGLGGRGVQGQRGRTRVRRGHNIVAE